MNRVGVTGHQDIPDSAIVFIRHGVQSILERFPPERLTGVSSLARGADQIFAELVGDYGGRLHIVLPSLQYEDSFRDEAALARFHQLLERAQVVETMPASVPSDRAYLLAGMHIVDTSDLIVAVWDGRSAKGAGGTADIVDYARQHLVKVEIVWPPGAIR